MVFWLTRAKAAVYVPQDTAENKLKAAGLMIWVQFHNAIEHFSVSGPSYALYFVAGVTFRKGSARENDVGCNLADEGSKADAAISARLVHLRFRRSYSALHS